MFLAFRIGRMLYWDEPLMLPMKGIVVTEKQNALEIIRFGRPEWIAEGLKDYGLHYLGCDHEGYDGGGHHLPVGARWTDIRGTDWRRGREEVMGFPRGNPLADWRRPDRLPLARPGRRAHLRQDARPVRLSRRGGVPCGVHSGTLWEKAYMLVGMEDLMCYFYTEPDAARELLTGSWTSSLAWPATT